jgi:DNA invertase Pin-like site-specific DNA recombinase
MVAYIRVSTEEQGKSGLGLEAQRAAIAYFANANGINIIAERCDVMSGKGSDALERRPKLLETLAMAKKGRCAVIVSKLDRLSRNVHFISGLMERKIPFYCVDLGMSADPFQLHIYAALAEKERNMISERTRAALQRKKAAGIMLGCNAHKTVEASTRFHVAGVAARQEAADDFARVVAPHIARIRSTAPGATYRALAAALNAWGVKTARGKEWEATSVRNLMLRMEKLSA